MLNSFSMDLSSTTSTVLYISSECRDDETNLAAWICPSAHEKFHMFEDMDLYMRIQDRHIV